MLDRTLLSVLRRRGGTPSPRYVSLDDDTLPAPFNFQQVGNRAGPVSADLQTWARIGSNVWTRTRRANGSLGLWVGPAYVNLVQNSRQLVDNTHWRAANGAPNSATRGLPSPDGSNSAIEYVCIANQFPQYEGPYAVTVPANSATYQITLKDGPTGNGSAVTLLDFSDSPIDLTGLSKTSWKTVTVLDPLGTRTHANNWYVEPITGEPGSGVGAGARDVIFDFILYAQNTISRDLLPWTDETGATGTDLRALNELFVDSAGYFNVAFEHAVPWHHSSDASAAGHEYFFSFTDADGLAHYLRRNGSTGRVELAIRGAIVATSAAALAYAAGADLSPQWWINKTQVGFTVGGVTTTSAPVAPLDLTKLPSAVRLFGDAQATPANQFCGYLSGNMIVRPT